MCPTIRADMATASCFKDYVLRQGKDYFETLMSDFRDLPDLNRETLEQYIDWDKTVKYVLERGEGECAV